MSAIRSEERLLLTALPGVERRPSSAEVAPQPKEQGAEWLGPNALVRWAFYLCAFSIPFTSVYVPGTGERLGVTRIVQLLIVAAAISQPRICLRFVPVALLWFLGYCGLRVAMGFWLTPQLSGSWWPSTLNWLQISLPWVWFLFNLMHFPGMGRRGLWALLWGCSLCAFLHLVGIGVAAVDGSEEGRTSIFGQNANIIGVTYASAIIGGIGMAMLKDEVTRHRMVILPMIGVLGIGLAKTGSRTAILVMGLGTLILLFQARSFSSRARRYLTLALIGLVFTAVIWQVPTVMKRFEKVGSSSLREHEGRVRMAPVLWEMFLRSPVYGSGPDHYRFELTRRAMPYLVREQKTISAHNLALLLLVETGVIGFLVFSVGLGNALVAAWRARLNRCGYLPLALLVPLVIAGLTVTNPLTNPVFWFVVAYALAGSA